MRSLGTAAFLLASLATAVAQAGDTTVNSAGRALSLIICSNCHLVDKDQLQSASHIGPSFFEVADRSSTTSMSLHAFLMSPHSNMPNIMLTRGQIDDVTDYILGLRNK